MFEAPAAAFCNDDDAVASRTIVDFRTPAQPEAGWATRNPERAMAFLFVSPRDGAMVEELLAA